MGDSDSDDDLGPRPAPAEMPDPSELMRRKFAHSRDDGDDDYIGNDTGNTQPKKRPRVKRQPGRYESYYLGQLPSAQRYECSYMHRDVVTHLVVSKNTEFIITGSADGHVKFWKKMEKTIEFVKHYQAHLSALRDMVISSDQKQLATTAGDQMIKIFDIASFDMTNMIEVSYQPNRAVWLPSTSSSTSSSSSSSLIAAADRIAVTDISSSLIRIYLADSQGACLQEVKLHVAPVCALAFNPVHKAVVSIDTKGIIEYWDPHTLQLPSSAVTFQYKTETSLYSLLQNRTTACHVAVSPNGEWFACTTQKLTIAFFHFASGKLAFEIDESVERLTALHTTEDENDEEEEEEKKEQADGIPPPPPSVPRTTREERMRRLDQQRQLEADPGNVERINGVFDFSSQLFIYCGWRGITVVSLTTQEVVRVCGAQDMSERFLFVALYQGVPEVDAQLLLARGANSGAGDSVVRSQPQSDPTFFVTGLHRRRFYCISSREPDEDEDSGDGEGRDKLNELPTEEERTGPSQAQAAKGLPSVVTLHTSLGDIVIKLYGTETPRAVENFTTHCSNGYYNNVRFHRVIKGFMIQTGDPLGDGTGGESIWGREFPDEFVHTLRHDRPYTVSMANAGPDTNGSQFFITVAPTPWLDNKHTVFGRVTAGYEIVHKIENLKVDKLDRPYDMVKILATTVHRDD